MVSRDVAVIGAGPVGCVAALALAQRGARVLLLEAHPQAARRLAGEWLHPAGVEVLQRLGVPDLGHRFPGAGFAVFPDDGTAPIVLPYPDGMTGFSCDHAAFVAALRAAAAGQVEYVPDARVTRIERGRVTFETAVRGEQTAPVGQVVGADGRASQVRRALGLPTGSAPISRMAGVLLEEVSLPREGYGHLFLGAAGPALVYRIGPAAIRACLDVPLAVGGADGPSYLWRSYGPAFPEPLRSALRRALDSQPIKWAANQFRPREQFGFPGLALVGDAVGYYHPLTAAGMALGFLDAERLAEVGGRGTAGFTEYQRERRASSRVPELLAAALYAVFTQHDEAAGALRQALYRLWRTHSTEAVETMRLLAIAETGLGAFSGAFVKVLGLASVDAVAALAHGELRRAARTAGGLGWWFYWLSSSAAYRASAHVGKYAL